MDAHPADSQRSARRLTWASRGCWLGAYVAGGVLAQRSTAFNDWDLYSGTTPTCPEQMHCTPEQAAQMAHRLDLWMLPVLALWVAGLVLHVLAGRRSRPLAPVLAGRLALVAIGTIIVAVLGVAAGVVAGVSGAGMAAWTLALVPVQAIMSLCSWALAGTARPRRARALVVLGLVLALAPVGVVLATILPGAGFAALVVVLALVPLLVWAVDLPTRRAIAQMSAPLPGVRPWPEADPGAPPADPWR